MSASDQADTVEYPPSQSHSKCFGPSPPPVQVTFGALSDVGKVRTNNEDHYLVVQRRRSRNVLLTNLPEGSRLSAEDTAYAMVVADGMGGTAFGELASRLALRTALDLGQSSVKWNMKLTEDEILELKAQMTLFIRLMDEALIERAQAQPELTGMGTTLTAAYTLGPEAFIAHVGDSRAYLHRSGIVVQLTHDHTLAQKLLDAGLPVTSRTYHHVLTNCLGGPQQGVEVDINHLRLSNGDRLLLCTDGLTNMLTDREIASILNQHAQPDAACRALVDGALDRGGKDNVTVVLGHYTLTDTSTSQPS